ncbi:growth/differentiation factor 8 [Lutzomyia longipalpis]|uniref:TGF-beta family profile domain-containing protein n=1 Tax=Lutzomyia longipalpis TaxID=7200 RepID=A0A1B0CEW9_LUTLO|nr:growth/differentiation factor 8 [Lutzomyia longipalpis]
MRWTLLLALVAVAYPAAGQTDNTIRRRSAFPPDDVFDEDSDESPSRPTCTACRVREDLKSASLEYIKAYVLHNLGFEHPPNLTHVPRVPESIYASFYNVTAATRHALDHDEDMLADAPADGTMTWEAHPVPERLYILGKVTKMRHGRRQPDILNFHISPLSHASVHRATLSIFVRGETWLRRHVNHDLPSLSHRPLNITVHRVVRSQIQPSDMVHLRDDASTLVNLDPGAGATITIDVTGLVTDWYNNPQTNYGLFLRTHDARMRQLLVLDDPGGKNVPFIEIVTRDRRHRRPKRSTSLTCRENESETRCCRYPLVVDFDKFGWDWVIAPKQYDANYCSGECSINFLTRYGHTHVMQLASSAQACCSPRKMAPLTLLYFNPQEQIVHTTLQNMIVQMCSCS